MDLPMSRIKESVPRMTYYNNSRDQDQVNGLPKEINGAQMYERSRTKGNISNRKRSMSASSAKSSRSFRATRKRPSLTMDGPIDEDMSKFRPVGGKFAQPIRNKKIQPVGKQLQALTMDRNRDLSQDLNHAPLATKNETEGESLQNKYLKNMHLIRPH